MQQTSLGSTTLRVSRLAYGCWRIANSGDDAIDFPVATRAIGAAVEAGCTLFDLADIYCDGRSETLFGRVLKASAGLRERVVVATKCGIRFAGEPSAVAPYRYDSSAAHIITSCEATLRRMGIETIDLYQLHRPDWLMNAEEIAAAFEQLARQGKVREFGVSNFAPPQVALLQQAVARPLAVNQIELSLLQLRPFTDGTLDQCQAQKLTPLAWSPLGGGMLGEGPVSVLPSQREYRPATVVAELDRIALDRGATRTAVALAWLLRHPAGVIPIVGSTQPERIHAAARATEIELTHEEWYRLLEAARGERLP